ncbi:uncharacterized protein PV07_12769, partial [Cladophialophora immunda]
KKLQSARDNLKQVSGSEEMRRLRDGSELQCADLVMVRAGARRRAAQLDVKRWEVFVKWIDDQYSAIAAECGYIDNDSRNNVTHQFGGNGHWPEADTACSAASAKRCRDQVCLGV